MNWKLILSLALFSVVMGFASVAGWTSGLEPFLWIAIWLVCAFVISRRVTAKIFLHGFFVGLLHGAINSIIQSSLFDLYLTNNPEFQDRFNQIPGGFPAQAFVLISGPIIGALSGLILGLLSLIASKTLKRRT